MKSGLAVGHLAITLLVLGLLNGLILQKERLLRRGTSMFLPLAPEDPRSLIQGDYMQLRYDLADSVLAREDGTPTTGRLVVRVGPDGVAVFGRMHHGEPLAAGERLLRFWRSRDGLVRFGADSFFFQEGDASRFATARYGELKVTPAGESVLVGLCDARRERLGVTAAGSR